MTKSQLIDRIAARVPNVPRRDVEAIVNAVFECMADALTAGQRIEVRGFGSFSVKTRPARDGRNPKTGAKVSVPPRRSLAFTAGKELRDRLNPDLRTGGDGVQSLPSRPAASGSSAPLAAEPLAAASPQGGRYTLG